MKKVAIFIGGYLPAQKYGGPVSSIANLVDNLGDDYCFKIITTDHDLHETKRLSGISNGWNCVGKAEVLYLRDREVSYSVFKKVLLEIGADLIYLNSFFSFRFIMPAICAARNLDIPIILAPRGELCDGAIKSGGIFKQAKKRIYITVSNVIGFFRNVRFHVTSQEEFDNVKLFFGTSDECVFYIPNMHGMTYRAHKPYKRIHELKIIFLARIHEKKNLLGAIRAVSKAQGNIQFDIYGPIEQGEYWDKCMQLISEVDERIRIEYKGSLAPNEAKSAFARYHCFLFPTYSENYGHVIAEALLCHCPVIISRNTTPWDDLDGVAGYTAELENDEEFTQCIDRLTEMNQEQYDRLIDSLDRFLERRLNIDELKSQYREMFECVMNNRK